MFLPASENVRPHLERVYRHPWAGAPGTDDVLGRLRAAGIRPTRQRVAICSLLFGSGDRHVSAEALFEETRRARLSVSRATVYNCLHEFAKRRMVRQLFIDSVTRYYDTNTTDHCHFISEVDGLIMDGPTEEIRLRVIAGVPDGLHVVDVQVLVKLRSRSDDWPALEGRGLAETTVSCSN